MKNLDLVSILDDNLKRTKLKSNNERNCTPKEENVSTHSNKRLTSTNSKCKFSPYLTKLPSHRDKKGSFTFKKDIIKSQISKYQSSIVRSTLQHQTNILKKPRKSVQNSNGYSQERPDRSRVNQKLHKSTSHPKSFALPKLNKKPIKPSKNRYSKCQKLLNLNFPHKSPLYQNPTSNTHNISNPSRLAEGSLSTKIASRIVTQIMKDPKNFNLKVYLA
ncbi:unnamed protein product [Moneuplotes crassus]|uniref:Uncharacterized protein n=1 Tax=Euplotes crassus TaxID=5936 RepID=A0AAD1XGR4_EUPCR|nr:unnamed protein product [Moneuplotes crassus]